MVYPTLLAVIGDVAHPAWRARAVGVYRLWRDGGFAVGALLAGILADAFGLLTAIWTIAGLTARVRGCRRDPHVRNASPRFIDDRGRQAPTAKQGRPGIDIAAPPSSSMTSLLRRAPNCAQTQATKQAQVDQ